MNRSCKSILNLERISDLRIYSNHQRISQTLGGVRIIIVSTSWGIMTNREAQLKKYVKFFYVISKRSFSIHAHSS